jgi:hypothetical protein
MKTLLLLLCAALTASVTEAAQRSSRSVEIITPTSTNLFVRMPNDVIVMGPVTNRFSVGAATNGFVRTSNNVIVVGATTNEIFASTNRFGTNIVAGSTNRLNVISLTNATPGNPVSSVLVGRVFPGPTTLLTPTGRSSGFEALQIVPGPIGTNAFGPNAFTNSVTRFPVQDLAVPAAPAAPGTVPLAPPTPPNIPQPTTPSRFPNPNAAPSVPSSATPTPPGTTPLAPPGGSAALAPPRPPPPAPAGGTR